MTLNKQTVLAGLKRSIRCLSLLFLPALSTEVAPTGLNAQNPPQRPGSRGYSSRSRGSSLPYLAVIATPPLRVRATPDLPDFETEASSAVPLAMEYVAPPPMVKEAPVGPDVILPVPLPATAASKAAPAVAPEAEAVPEIPRIIPDDLRHDIRPEDLLPFFQFPKDGFRIGVGVPVPAQPKAPAQPPSSATYTQQ